MEVSSRNLLLKRDPGERGDMMRNQPFPMDKRSPFLSALPKERIVATPLQGAVKKPGGGYELRHGSGASIDGAGVNSQALKP